MAASASARICVGQIEVRPLADDERDVAAVLLPSAFVDEPYVVEMHGADPLVRWAEKHARHVRDLAEARYAVRLLALADGAPVGVLLGSLPGACNGCTRGDLSRPAGADGGDPMDEAWYRNAAQAHATQPEHGWVSKLGTVPAVQGRGVAAALLTAMDGVVREAGGSTVLLECQPHREAFYERHGYRRALLIPDPAGPDAPLMAKPL